MKLKKLLTPIIMLLSIFALNMPTYAANKEMAAFFDNPENQKKFKLLVDSGMFTKIRETELPQTCSMLNELAKKEKMKEKLDCNCYIKKMSSLSDKQLFFISLSAYQNYQKKMAAMQKAKLAGNTAEVERLKKQAVDVKHPLENEIQQDCITK